MIKLTKLLMISCYMALVLSSIKALAANPLCSNQWRFEHLSVDQGLSQNYINDSITDSHGFLWVATSEGLNRYDGYNIAAFRHDISDPRSISSSEISKLFISRDGTLWIGTKQGLNRYNSDQVDFDRFGHDPQDSQSLSNHSINDIVEDANGYLWIATDKGLNRLEPKTGIFKHWYADKHTANGISSDSISALAIDAKQQLWIGSYKGLDRFDLSTNQFKHFGVNKANSASLNYHVVISLFVDRKQRLWVGTYGAGLNLLNEQGDGFSHFKHDKHQSNSLSNNIIWSINEDAQGRLLVATEQGLNRFNHGVFERVVHDPIDPQSLNDNLIYDINVDSNGLIWLGTFSGGVNKYDPATRLFCHVKDFSTSGQPPSHSNVLSVYQDSSNNIWIGGEQGLFQYDPMTADFNHYYPQDGVVHGLKGEVITAIESASHGALWLGTKDQGVEHFDIGSGKFSHYQSEKNNPNSLDVNVIRSIYKDSTDTVWVGTSAGLNRYYPQQDHFAPVMTQRQGKPQPFGEVLSIFEDRAGGMWIGTATQGISYFHPRSGVSREFRFDSEDMSSLSNDSVHGFYQDQQGHIWVATLDGLNRFEAQSATFTRFAIKDGNGGGNIAALSGDQQGHLWLSTSHGLIRFDHHNEQLVYYHVADGLQGKVFNTAAVYKSADGALLFGGSSGFNRFYPHQIAMAKPAPRVVLTDLLIFNKRVAIAADADGASFGLSKQLDRLNQLTLEYHQSQFSFEFAGLSFSSQPQLQYAYQLTNWDRDWIETDAKNRRATYTNIPAGDYIFKVKVRTTAGGWGVEEKTLNLRINPPFWRTWWAYLIYFVTFVGSLSLFIWRQKLKVLKEQKIVQQLKQVDRLKDEFLANTSHELRTPLNGIIGLAESLVDGVAGPLPPKAQQNLNLVITSGQQLSNLVNDILDFSKLENQSIQLNTTAIDLHALVGQALNLLQPLVGNKPLSLHNQVDQSIVVEADEERLQQIFYNLIGNGIKFTEAGEVVVMAQQQQQKIKITVKDSGIGIQAQHLERIFGSFEQVDGQVSRQYGGTGLGLAVSERLARLHGSQIEVHSTVGEGSEFSFYLSRSTQLPSEKVAAKPMVSRVVSVAEEQQTQTETPAQLSHSNECVVNRAKATAHQLEPENLKILVVDDEQVNRRVLCDHLSMKRYQTLEAQNGEEALRLLAQQGPFDLVLLDIMMPQLSGIEVCEQIRQQWTVQELPVIFLTAKNQVEDLVESFAVGANDYLTKPVIKNELLARVDTHLKMLDINRNLEHIVAQRTAEVERQKDQLIEQKEQVEQQNKTLIDTQQQLVQSEKMASLGTLTAGVAHEINNPTNFAHVSAQNLAVDLEAFQQFILALVEDDQEDSEVVTSFKRRFSLLFSHINTICNGTERIKGIVKDLHAFSHMDKAEQTLADIGDCLQSTVNLIATSYDERVDIYMCCQSTPPILCYPAQLNQVFMNLLVNACDAIETHELSGAKGKIDILCHEVDDWIEVLIKDNGCGMSEAIISRIFEPFYTTKDVGKGTGLGLSISYGIVQKHHGRLEVSSTLGEGTEFRLSLPCSGH